MKTNVRRALIIPLIASFIAGSTLLLSWSIAKAQGVENSTIVTDSLTGTAASASTINADTPDFTISKRHSIVPKNGDLSLNDAAMICAKKIKHYFNADTADGRMTMMYINSYKADGEWQANFIPADGLYDYFLDIDSVSGKIHIISRLPKSKTPDCDSSKCPDGRTEQEQQMQIDALLSDTHYKDAAIDFMKATMPDKQIVSAQATMLGSESSVTKINFSIVVVDVKLSDGNSYGVHVGIQTFAVFGWWPPLSPETPCS